MSITIWLIKHTIAVSIDLEGGIVLQHLLELFVLDLPIAGVVDRADELLDIDGEVELLLDDPDQHEAVDVPGFVGWPANGRVGV